MSLQTPDGKAFQFYPTPDRPIPRSILMGAGALALGAIVSIGFGRVTGVGRFETPTLQTLASRDLQLEELGDKGVEVRDADNGTPLITLPQGDNFAVEALRNLQRHRARQGVANSSMPYVLALKSDGRLVVEDPATHVQVELRAFGERQAKLFAQFLIPNAGSR